ncbi:MAG: exodeoxyribonuclease VII small subunit [Ignavibacterium sp.]
MTARKPSQLTFESAMKRLEEIVRLLEDEETPLERAIDLYEEGLQLSRYCTSTLKGAEARFKKLAKAADGQFEVTDLE